MELLPDIFSSPEVIAMLIGLVLLICGSAFSAASETSLFSLRPADLEEMEATDEKGAARVERLLKDREYTLATILIFNNTVNIGIVLLSALIVGRTMRFDSAAWEFVFTSVIVTFILLLFGEIMPKVFATYNKRKFARACAPVVATARTLLRPAAWLLVTTGSRIKGKSRENVSLEELSDALDVTRAGSDQEKHILEGIVSFAGREVGQIMRPRLDMTTLDAEDDFERVKEVIVSSGFSRIPVFEENIDHIAGVLYIKDVVPHIAAGADFDWRKLMRRAHFIPEHKKIDDLLEEFQAGKVHIAIVVDEYGATRGLVSLEDILEEIVGEISDESDLDSALYTRTGEGEYIFDGKTHLGDVTRALELDEDFFDEVRGEAETLAGLMLEIRRGFLRRGESVVCGDLRLTALSLEGRRIDRIKVGHNFGRPQQK
ncbi:MAG: gliding motility-associated protein GldE [Alistipes sp.]|jgi:gliding motility-associated protein GldE|nr:gliding motility-associated protein GldE [Alistipes sp.]